MTPIPGKACGSCIMCCTALEIPELKKPAGPALPQLHPVRRLHDLCGAVRKVCRDFECLWINSRELPPNMRPDGSARF